MNVEQILDVLDKSGIRDHTMVSQFPNEDNQKFLLWFKHYATGVSLDSGVDHTLITLNASDFYGDNHMNGKIMLAVYDLRGGIEIILKPQYRYHHLEVYFPTGKLANRLGSEVIKLGEVPYVRVLGNCDPKSGLTMLKDFLNECSDCLSSVQIGYHADVIGDETFLKGGLARFFRDINILPIEGLCVNPKP